MGYVFDFKDSKKYEKWILNPSNQNINNFKKKLLLDMLDPKSGDRFLDIGCGTGHEIYPLLDLGLKVTALDPSPYMIDIAQKGLKNRVDFYQDFVEDLPFDDNSFNYSSFMLTLEFVEDLKKALEEACRVTKDKLFICCFNKYALKINQAWIKEIFSETISNHINLYSIWEIKNNIKSILGDVPIFWKTACLFPDISGGLIEKIEQSSLIQRCPFGIFTGFVVYLLPRFRTKPLNLSIQAEQNT